MLQFGHTQQKYDITDHKTNGRTRAVNNEFKWKLLRSTFIVDIVYCLLKVFLFSISEIVTAWSSFRTPGETELWRDISPALETKTEWRADDRERGNDNELVGSRTLVPDSVARSAAESFEKLLLGFGRSRAKPVLPASDRGTAEQLRMMLAFLIGNNDPEFANMLDWMKAGSLEVSSETSLSHVRLQSHLLTGDVRTVTEFISSEEGLRSADPEPRLGSCILIELVFLQSEPAVVTGIVATISDLEVNKQNEYTRKTITTNSSLALSLYHCLSFAFPPQSSRFLIQFIILEIKQLIISQYVLLKRPHIQISPRDQPTSQTSKQTTWTNQPTSQTSTRKFTWHICGNITSRIQPFWFRLKCNEGGPTCLCVSRCLVNMCDDVNPASHCSHMNGRSSAWLLTWRYSKDGQSLNFHIVS